MLVPTDVYSVVLLESDSPHFVSSPMVAEVENALLLFPFTIISTIDELLFSSSTIGKLSLGGSSILDAISLEPLELMELMEDTLKDASRFRSTPTDDAELFDILEHALLLDRSVKFPSSQYHSNQH